jgi:hypothetical protein
LLGERGEVEPERLDARRRGVNDLRPARRRDEFRVEVLPQEQPVQIVQRDALGLLDHNLAQALVVQVAASVIGNAGRDAEDFAARCLTRHHEQHVAGREVVVGWVLAQIFLHVRRVETEAAGVLKVADRDDDRAARQILAEQVALEWPAVLDADQVAEPHGFP